MYCIFTLTMLVTLEYHYRYNDKNSDEITIVENV